MLSVNSALTSTTNDVLRKHGSNTILLNSFIHGATPSVISRNQFLMNAQGRPSSIATRVQKLVAKQKWMLESAKQTSRIIEAAKYVESGAVGNILEGLSLLSKVEDERKRISEGKKSGRIRFLRKSMPKDEQDLLERTELFGGGPEGRAMAEQDIARERHDKASDIVKERRRRDRKRSISADMNFRYDMMSDRDREISDLLERYNGDRRKVDLAMDKRDREKYLKVLPKMFNQSKFQTKTLGNIAKIYQSSGGLAISKKIKGLGPVGAGFTLAASIMAVAGQIFERELSADRKIVDLKKTEGMYGSLRDKKGRITGTGILALSTGLDEKSAAKSWGAFNSQWGGQGLLALKAFRDATKDIPQWAVPLVAKEFGMDENLVSMSQNMYKRYKDLTPEQQNVIAAELTERERINMSSSSGTLGESILSMITDNSFGRGVSRSSASDQLVTSVAAAQQAAESASNYSASTSKEGQSVSYGNTSFHIENANFTGPNVKSMVKDITDKSDIDSERKQQALKAFDGGQ